MKGLVTTSSGGEKLHETRDIVVEKTIKVSFLKASLLTKHRSSVVEELKGCWLLIEGERRKRDFLEVLG